MVVPRIRHTTIFALDTYDMDKRIASHFPELHTLGLQVEFDA